MRVTSCYDILWGSLEASSSGQGLTLEFQARGPKRSFDKKWLANIRIPGYNTYYFEPLIWKI